MSEQKLVSKTKKRFPKKFLVDQIKEAEKNLVKSFWLIGKLLHELVEDGYDLKSIVNESNFSFSYERARQFKKVYENFSQVNSDEQGVLYKDLGVERLLALADLPEDSRSDFIEAHPLEEIKRTPVRIVHDKIKKFSQKNVSDSDVTNRCYELEYHYKKIIGEINNLVLSLEEGRNSYSLLKKHLKNYVNHDKVEEYRKLILQKLKEVKA